MEKEKKKRERRRGKREKRGDRIADLGIADYRK